MEAHPDDALGVRAILSGKQKDAAVPRDAGAFFTMRSREGLVAALAARGAFSGRTGTGLSVHHVSGVLPLLLLALV